MLILVILMLTVETTYLCFTIQDMCVNPQLSQIKNRLSVFAETPVCISSFIHFTVKTKELQSRYMITKLSQVAVSHVLSFSISSLTCTRLFPVFVFH